VRTVVSNHELRPERLELESLSIDPGRIASPPRRPAEMCALSNGECARAGVAKPSQRRLLFGTVKTCEGVGLRTPT
jgi:hypothetical protein